MELDVVEELRLVLLGDGALLVLLQKADADEVLIHKLKTVVETSVQ